ncbi:hypothetical protein BGZ49_008059 [Haplosporangium sp. Z 27]|nr:hypothetical protein BGZ49_008059 [Haplosporangium sp. Z 27]
MTKRGGRGSRGARWVSHPQQGRGGRGGGRGGSGGRGGRGGSGGRGGRGSQSSGFKRRHQSDEAVDGFIPLSGRQIGEYYRELQKARRQGDKGSSRGRSGKGKYKSTEVRFNKAVHTGPPKSRGGSKSDDETSDQGLDSDEIDESEEEFLMQEFEWIEDDQDPDRNNKVKSPLVLQPDSEPIVSITGWGGALAYHTPSQSNSNLQDMAGEDLDLTSRPSISIINVGDCEKDSQSMAGIVSQTTPSQTVGSLKNFKEYTSAVSKPLSSHKHKRLKAGVDLSDDVQIKLRIRDTVSDKDSQNLSVDAVTNSTNETEQESLLWVMDTNPDPVAAAGYIPDTRPLRITADKIDVVTGAANVEYIVKAAEKLQHEPTSASASAEIKKRNSRKEQEHDTSLWMMDTVGETLAKEEAKESYIDLPFLENESSGRKRKKTRRSKRGGKKIRENEKERIRLMVEDGGLMLEEDLDESVDEEEQLLQDYIQNTMDSDDEDGTDSLMGLLQGVHSGFGHSNDIGGMDPDDSDFEEGASQDDSHDDEDFDFTSRSRERRRKKQMDDGLSRALDGALSPSWPSGIPQGYEKFLDDVAQRLDASDPGVRGSSWRRRRGEPHGGSVKSLSEINETIEEFVRHGGSEILQLPPMMTALRRRVHLLSTHYGLRSESVGKGKHRSPVLIRTDRTKLPKSADQVMTILTQSDKEIKKRTVEFNQSQSWGRRSNRRHREEGVPNRTVDVRITNGAVVGATAAPISNENVGHRLLSKMGWTPGDGLGASGGGITNPIEAVMKRTRGGLGHGK